MIQGPKATWGEKKVYDIFVKYFANKQQYHIEKNPKDFKEIYGGKYRAEIKLAISNKDTQRKIFIEIKRQGDRGNAHERICMYLVPNMVNIGRKKGNIRKDDFPFWILFWDGLAKGLRYREQFKIWFQGHENSMTLWKDISDEKPVIEHFEKHIAPRLS